MTEADHIWQQIIRLLGEARSEVVLVAPFIKHDVFEDLVAVVPGTVSRIECTTRWSPAEVAAGVSDPEIIEVTQTDERVTIALCPSLHAKLYVADSECLIGSANLTGSATGRSPAPNLEILVDVPVGHPEVQRVLNQMGTNSVKATEELAALVRQQADYLSEPDRVLNLANPEPWYPQTRRPENVYELYSGRKRFTSAVEAGIIADLATLDVPVGLSKSDFNAEVEARLRAMPDLELLHTQQRLSGNSIQQAIEARGGVTPDQAQRMAETLAAWLKHFGHYYSAVESWELRPGRQHR